MIKSKKNMQRTHTVKDMEQLGAEVFEYKLEKLEENDIIISEKQKNTPVIGISEVS